MAGHISPGTLSPPRPVPKGIDKPSYWRSGHPKEPRRVQLQKSPGQIRRMRRACDAAAEVLTRVGAAVRPGVTTDELDAICHDATIELGGYPSPLNYHGYPKSLCTSVNEVICHGIPDDRPLEDGDIVNLDVTVFLAGMHGDTSKTYPVGDVDAESARLLNVTYECMWAGIDAVHPGGDITDIGRAIQGHAEANGFGVVRDFVGHGIGEQFHTKPSVTHYYDPNASFELLPGMTFTIEPMITMGDWHAEVWDDGWTAVTVDGRRTAQFEHTVLVADTGFEVLTLGPLETPPDL
ncbi:MAG: type I methionyl aminopeptidase [Acidimicrobiia bacterium]